MKRLKNTHYCFLCGGDVGFRPAKVGRFIKRNDISKPTNCFYSGRNQMSNHDASHVRAVVGNVNRYEYVWDWLQKEIGRKKDFPFVVSVPSCD